VKVLSHLGALMTWALLLLIHVAACKALDHVVLPVCHAATTGALWLRWYSSPNGLGVLQPREEWG
jgi:hypothetical protein